MSSHYSGQLIKGTVKGIENDNVKRYSSAYNLQAQKRRSFHVSSTSHPEITFKTLNSAK